MNHDRCPELHNLHRRDLGDLDTATAVENGIANLHEVYGNQFGTITVCSNYSLKYIERTLYYFARSLKLYSLKFNMVHPNNVDFDMSTLIAPCDIPHFYDRLITKLVALNLEGYEIYESNLSVKLENLLTHNYGDLCHSHGCTGGYTFVTFSREGKIYPCELVYKEDLLLGNIDDDEPLEEQIGRNLHNRYFTSKVDRECRKCDWLPFCRGGCTASAISYGSKGRMVDPMECNINRYLYPKLVSIILENPEYVKILTGGKFEIIT